jgi:hypothetical protein
MSNDKYPRVIRDGKVAVLYSPGYGAGWFSWNTDWPAMVFDPDMVAAVESGDCEAQERIASEKWPNAYTGGLPLKIEWIDKGERFEINEYDGSESVRVFGPDEGFVA